MALSVSIGNAQLVCVSMCLSLLELLYLWTLGKGLIGEAGAVSILAYVLSANTLLRAIVKKINRELINTEMVEATYTIFVMAHKGHQHEGLQKLELELKHSNTPHRISKFTPSVMIL